MRLSNFTLTILFIYSGFADAGWMDSLKSQIEGAVNQTIGQDPPETKQSPESSVQDQSGHETAKSNPQQTSATVTDPDKLELYGGHSSPWNVAPDGATRVLDVEIKGMRLGMPEALIDEVLTKNGFEKVGYNSYSKDVVEINGQVREVTRSQQRGKSVEEMGKLLRRYSISFRTAEPSEAFLAGLDEPLKVLVAKARDRLKVAGDEEQRISASRGRGDSRTRSAEYSNVARKLNLVYRFEYQQYFANDVRFDRNALMKQFRDLFGQPTYQPKGDGMRHGSAFGTNEYSWLIYHDAALVPVAKRDDLLRKIVDKGDRWAMKDAFSHPCGASPTQVMNCVNNPLARLYKDDLDSRLEAAKIIYAPVMTVHFRSPTVKATLEWQYLLGEKGIRERFDKHKAVQALPKATVDF